MDKKLLDDIAAGRLVKIGDVAFAANISARSIYRKIQEQRIAGVDVGGSLRIPASEAARVLGLKKEVA